jgi:hypothetical protein
MSARYKQLIIKELKTMEPKCLCIKTVAENIVKRLGEDKKNPKGFKIIDFDWSCQTIWPEIRLYADFEYKSTFEKSDGTTSKPKNNKISMYFTYCPFCGVKL